MSVTKDKKTGRWMSQCRVKDWTGKTIHKKKRGFATKRDALNWEQDFLSHVTPGLDMRFQDFSDLYLKDMEQRLKPSTFSNKQRLLRLKILPHFGRMPLNSVKPTDIRQWQNELISFRDENGKPYSPTYLKAIQVQLTAVFNYAVKYYGMQENPCRKAGSIGSERAREMLFWTKDEFLRFIDATRDCPSAYAAFMTLYYTGIREGELLALTGADVDLENCVIRINKSFQRLSGMDLITTPKTPKSNRSVTISPVLRDCLRVHIISRNIGTSDRLFPFTKYYLYNHMKRACKKSGVKRIRVHDIRHSHASLLVEMGFSPLLIAERLGHEHVQTTMETYSHLYPNKQTEVANKLEEYMKQI